MNVVPASVAGVEEIIAVTPPGGITDAVLAACSLAGVSRLFRIGGARRSRRSRSELARFRA